MNVAFFVAIPVENFGYDFKLHVPGSIPGTSNLKW